MDTTNPKMRTWLYGTCTALLSFGLAFGAFSDLTRSPEVLAVLERLGYPIYLTTILGTWKLLAIPTLLVPGLPRLKEWAYAGIFFDLTGAAISHVIVGDPAPATIIPLVFLLFAFGSWALRPASRALRAPRPGESPEVDVRAAALAATGGTLVLAAAVSAGHASDRPAMPPEPAHGDARTRAATSDERPTPTDVARAAEVVDFWREAGPRMWFAKDPEFDRRFRERFLALHEAAARGALDGWAESPEGALGLLILLDQFPRNAFRGTPRMYDTDAKAREVASAVVGGGLDQRIEQDLRLFVYLPFAHSERLEDQARSVELSRALGEPHLTHAQGHYDIIRRFGRFPHRNPILGRTMRPEEQAFLDAGGFSG